MFLFYAGEHQKIWTSIRAPPSGESVTAPFLKHDRAAITWQTRSTKDYQSPAILPVYISRYLFLNDWVSVGGTLETENVSSACGYSQRCFPVCSSLRYGRPYDLHMGSRLKLSGSASLCFGHWKSRGRKWRNGFMQGSSGYPFCVTAFTRPPWEIAREQRKWKEIKKQMMWARDSEAREGTVKNRS